jgi:hypothetical protein
MRRIVLSALSVFLGLALAGCNTDSPPAPAAAMPGTPGGAVQRTAVAGPPGCAKPIAEYEALVDRDVTTGYLSQVVYDRLNGELAAGPRAACAGGRAPEALAALARVKNAHGYR